jgi:hypothetical protein
VNRWSRIVLALGWLAFLGWLATGALGFRVVDDGTLVEHTLLGFVALLALVLTQSWIAVFALVSLRLVRRRGAGERPELRALARARTGAVVGALAAVAAATAQFTVSNALYPGRLAARSHLAAAIASAVVVLVALLVEAWALRRHGRAIESLER